MSWADVAQQAKLPARVALYNEAFVQASGVPLLAHVPEDTEEDGSNT